MNLECVATNIWDGINSKLSRVKPAYLVISSVAGTIVYIRLYRLYQSSEKSIYSRFFLIILNHI